MGKVIDSQNSQPLVFAANEISKIEAYACSDLQTASMTGEVCAYRLKVLIGADYPIMPDSSIEVELPDDLFLVDAASTTKKSSTDGIADLRATFTVADGKDTTFGQPGRQVVVVKNAFAKASAPNGVDWR